MGGVLSKYLSPCESFSGPASLARPLTRPSSPLARPGTRRATLTPGSPVDVEDRRAILVFPHNMVVVDLRVPSERGVSAEDGTEMWAERDVRGRRTLS